MGNTQTNHVIEMHSIDVAAPTVGDSPSTEAPQNHVIEMHSVEAAQPTLDETKEG
jgi:hypothetical protein